MVNEIKGCLKLDSNLQGTGWGEFIQSVGKIIKFGRGDGNIKAVGTNINWKKGKHYPLSFHIKAVGKNIKKENGPENMVNLIKLKKNGDREENQDVGNYIHHCQEIYFVVFSVGVSGGNTNLYKTPGTLYLGFIRVNLKVKN